MPSLKQQGFVIIDERVDLPCKVRGFKVPISHEEYANADFFTDIQIAKDYIALYKLPEYYQIHSATIELLLEV